MLVALFEVEKVLSNEEERSLIYEGIAVGEIKVGMFYRIQFNRYFGMTVPISSVALLGGDKMQIRADFEDVEEFEIVYAMNVGHEIFEIHDSE